MHIRRMCLADVAQVAAIERSVQYHPWTAKQFEEAVTAYHVMVMEQDNQVIAFCILQPVLDEANLLLMATHPDFQGRGYAFTLLNHAIDTLPNSPVQIFLEVRESNVAAIRLYEKTGFHQIDVRKNYYPLPNGAKENAMIMVKSCSDDFAALFKS